MSDWYRVAINGALASLALSVGGFLLGFMIGALFVALAR